MLNRFPCVEAFGVPIDRQPSRGWQRALYAAVGAFVVVFGQPVEMNGTVSHVNSHGMSKCMALASSLAVGIGRSG